MAGTDKTPFEQRINAMLGRMWKARPFATSEEGGYKGWDYYQESGTSITPGERKSVVTICNRQNRICGQVKRKNQHKVKAHLIDFGCVTNVNLIPYGGRIHYKNGKPCVWTDFELPTTPDLLENIKSAITDTGDTNAEVVKLLEKFTNLEVLNIIIEVPYSQRDNVYSPLKLAMIQSLLAFPGARVFVRFDTTRTWGHPSIDLLERWNESWSEALKYENMSVCHLLITDG